MSVLIEEVHQPYSQDKSKPHLFANPKQSFTFAYLDLQPVAFWCLCPPWDPISNALHLKALSEAIQ